MDLIGLYKIADENGISVYHFPLSPIKSMSVPGSIGIDADMLETTRDEKELLAHELGHCMRNAFYTGRSDFQLRGQCEAKANKWEVETLIPFDELEIALKDGCCEKWEIAEYFDVPETVVELASKLYEDRLIKLRAEQTDYWD